MKEVCEELDNLKAENEKLRADFKSKTDLLENLKRANNEQREKLQEACSKINRKEKQLLDKEEQVCLLRQECEDVKCKLADKDAVVRSLSVANDRLRAEADERGRTWEEENRKLTYALDESNEQKFEQEQRISALRAELEGVKACLSASENKSLEVEKMAKNSKELREMDDMLIRFEEEKRKVEDQLKWKKEQFEHLKEAYEKLQKEFRIDKKEWEQERSSLIEEICSLQINLDSQMRISKDLQIRLDICNQALAREESRRTHLEVEVSEFRSRYDDVFSECEEVKSQLECVSAQRDKEIASLRNSLGTKETFYKELKYQNRMLEQENDDLKMSLKDFREAKIHEAGSSSSLSKLRLKLKSVEKLHKESLADHRAKEVEWNCRLEEMAEALNDCRSQLGRKDSAIEKLKMEFESCLSSAVQLRLQNEEISVMLLVLTTAFSEAHHVDKLQAQIGTGDKEVDNNASFLMQQLELKDAALAKAKRDLAAECEAMKLLSGRIESLQLVEKQKHVMQKELDRCKEMLKESYTHQVKLKEQVTQVESCLQQKIKEICDDLDLAHLELAEEREKVASLLLRIESVDAAEKQWQQMEKELEQYKELLSGMTKSHCDLEKQALLLENESKKKLGEASDALQAAVSELAEERERAAALAKKVDSLEHNEKQWLLTQKEVCDALESAVSELAEEPAKSLALAKRLESMEHNEEQWLMMQKEVESAVSELAEERMTSLALAKRLESMEHNEEQWLMMQKEVESAVSELAEEREKSLALAKRLESMEHNEEKWLMMQKEVESAVSELAEGQAKSLALAKRLESMEHNEEQWLMMQKEVERYKETIETSSRHQLQLEAQISTISTDSKRKLREAREALDKADSEMLDRTCRANEIEFELWIWRSIAERLNSDLERSNEVRKDIEESLLQQVEDGEAIKQERENLFHKLQQKDSRINNLEEQLCSLEKELNTKELTAVSSCHELERTITELQREKLNLQATVTNLCAEKENLHGLMETLDCKMNELSSQDSQMAGMLARMTKPLAGEDSKCLDSAQENTLMQSLPSPTTTKKLQATTEERSPFRPLN